MKAFAPLRNEAGAFDLPSILAGTVTVAILTAGVLAAVFGVIPLTQDHSARQDLSAIQTAQGAARTHHNGYADKWKLMSLGLVNPLSEDTWVAADAAGFCAVTRSASGRVFSVSTGDSGIREGDTCSGGEAVFEGGTGGGPTVPEPPIVPVVEKYAAPGFTEMCGATRTSPVWTIPDSTLQRAVSDIVQPCGPLTLHDASGLTDVAIRAYEIGSLEGLAEASNIRTLLLDGQSGGAYPDMTALRDLPQLGTLTVMNYTSATDLNGIGQAPALKKLTLRNMGFLDDIGPLANLGGLEELSISSMPVSDLVPLQDLKSLTSLTVSGNTFLIDLRPLGGLANLMYLDISHTYVRHLEPLSNLHALQTLNAADTLVSDWAPVDHVPNVEGRPAP